MRTAIQTPWRPTGKTAGNSEPASYAWVFSTSTGSAGGILAFSGVDTANPIDVEDGGTTANGLTHAAPSVTTTDPLVSRTGDIIETAGMQGDRLPGQGQGQAADVV